MLVIGSKGYLGSKFTKHFNAKTCDKIQSQEDAFKFIEESNEDIVINCAGVTGRPNIDWCESHKEETIFGNVTVPLYIAKACDKLGKGMVHIGSGCIYSGSSERWGGFSEKDLPNFTGSIYSVSKILCERMLQDYKVLQLRIRMPIDKDLNERSFITKLVNYAKNGVIINESNSMTIIEDLIFVVDSLIKNDYLSGVFNVTNPGAITHVQILEMYKEIIDPNLEWKVVDTNALISGLAASRSNCNLNTDKLQSIIRLQYIRDGIEGIFKGKK